MRETLPSDKNIGVPGLLIPKTKKRYIQEFLGPELLKLKRHPLRSVKDRQLLIPKTKKIHNLPFLILRLLRPN
jgi:hypothetical protein